MLRAAVSAGTEMGKEADRVMKVCNTLHVTFIFSAFLETTQ